MRLSTLYKKGWQYQEWYGGHAKIIKGFDGRIWWTMLHSATNIQIFRNRIKTGVFPNTIESELKYDGKPPANLTEYNILTQLLGIKK